MFTPYLLTPWSRDLLEKLTGFQLVKKFPALYGNRRFITAIWCSRAQVKKPPYSSDNYAIAAQFVSTGAKQLVPTQRSDGYPASAFRPSGLSARKAPTARRIFIKRLMLSHMRNSCIRFWNGRWYHFGTKPTVQSALTIVSAIRWKVEKVYVYIFKKVIFFLTFIGPYIANIFAQYNQKDGTYHNLFISLRRFTCFRRGFRPSTGAQNCTYSVRHLSDQNCYLLLAKLADQYCYMPLACPG